MSEREALFAACGRCDNPIRCVKSGGCCLYPKKVAECGCKWYVDGTNYVCVTHQSGGVYP